MLQKLIEYFRRKRTLDAESARHRLSLRPSREDVYHAFRLILGREPENEADINAHLKLSSVAELRSIMLNSSEFEEKYRGLHPAVTDHPNLDRARRTVALLHFQKTGGTTLRKMLEQHFPLDRRCPILEDKIHILSLAELGRYDFFGGHFDISALRFIPRDFIETVAMFREPAARLISFYRFLKAHPNGHEFDSNVLVKLAWQFSPEVFFERPELRSFSAFNNHYLIALARSFIWFDQHHQFCTDDVLAALLQDAKHQICAMKSFGLTERFKESVQLIFHALSLPAPTQVEEWNVTDRLTETDVRFRQVDPVEPTDRLLNAMADLVKYDCQIYRFASDEFENRLAGSRTNAVIADYSSMHRAPS